MKNLVLKSVFVVAALGCGLMSQEVKAGNVKSLSQTCLKGVHNGSAKLIGFAEENHSLAVSLGAILAAIGATRYLAADNNKDFTLLGINFNKVWGGALFIFGSMLAAEGGYAKIPLSTKATIQNKTGLSEATITPLRSIQTGTFWVHQKLS